MKKNKLRWFLLSLITIIILSYSMLFSLYEGNVVVVTRFGAADRVIKDAGLHFKLPWPFEQVHIYDGRKQYYDTSYIETLTKDKKNIILQAYVVWNIQDPLKFLESTGSEDAAKIHLNSLVTSAKNAVLGKYQLSNIVSTNTEELKLDEIEKAILDDVKSQASERYGLLIDKIGFKRVGLPEANVAQVFEQMSSERQRYVAQLRAEGERDASIIRNETDVKVAELKAEGVKESAEIYAQTEKEVSKIYADAQKEDPELYIFLKKLELLENTSNSQTTFVFSTDSEPFDILDEKIEVDEDE